MNKRKQVALCVSKKKYEIHVKSDTNYTNLRKLATEFSGQKRDYCRIPRIVLDVSLVPTILIFCSVFDARLYSA